MEASVDPLSRGPDWKPITPKTGSLLHAETQPAIRRLVGAEGNLGEEIGLSNNWVVRVLRAVGNYGETFDRNIGTRSKLGLPRGLNHLWAQGGIQYAPPFE